MHFAFMLLVPEQNFPTVSKPNNSPVLPTNGEAHNGNGHSEVLDSTQTNGQHEAMHTTQAGGKPLSDIAVSKLAQLFRFFGEEKVFQMILATKDGPASRTRLKELAIITSGQDNAALVQSMEDIGLTEQVSLRKGSGVAIKLRDEVKGLVAEIFTAGKEFAEKKNRVKTKDPNTREVERGYLKNMLFDPEIQAGIFDLYVRVSKSIWKFQYKEERDPDDSEFVEILMSHELSTDCYNHWRTVGVAEQMTKILDEIEAEADEENVCPEAHALLAAGNVKDWYRFRKYLKRDARLQHGKLFKCGTFQPQETSVLDEEIEEGNVETRGFNWRPETHRLRTRLGGHFSGASNRRSSPAQ